MRGDGRCGGHRRRLPTGWRRDHHDGPSLEHDNDHHNDHHNDSDFQFDLEFEHHNSCLRRELRQRESGYE